MYKGKHISVFNISLFNNNTYIAILLLFSDQPTRVHAELFLQHMPS